MASVLAFTECYQSVQNNRLTIMTSIICGSIFSMFGSSFVLSSYLSVIRSSGVTGTWSGYFNRYEGINLLVALLALSDYLFSVNCITTYFLLLFDHNAYTNTVCVIFRGWFQISEASSFLITVCIAIYLRALIINQVDLVRESPRYWVSFVLFSWGIPIGGTFILIGLRKVVPSNFGPCFPQQDYYMYLWLLPLQLPFLYNFVTFIYLSYVLYDKRKNLEPISPDIEDLSIDIRTEVRMILYIFIYILCWGLDFAVWMSYYYFKICIPYELVIFSCFTHYIQGFLNCMVYGFTNRNIREFISSKIFLAIIFNILIAPIAIWPKAILFIIFQIKNSFLPVEKPYIEYTTGDDSSSLIKNTISPTAPPSGDINPILYQINSKQFKDY